MSLPCRRIRFLRATCATVLLVTLAACGGGGGDDDAAGAPAPSGNQPPAPAVPPAEQPPAEQPPAQQPPEEQPPEEQPPVEEPPVEPPPTVPVVSGPAGLLINEVHTANWSGARDEDGDAEDWVEIYNPTDARVNLAGWALSNKTASLRRWMFPAAAVIEPRAYLTVWLSKKNRQTWGRALHASFNLDNGGSDPIILTATDGSGAAVQVDTTPTPLVRPDHSLCRMPGGNDAGAFVICIAPTRGAANGGASYATMLERPAFSQASGFYAAPINVTLTGPTGAQIRYTTDGSEPGPSSPLYDQPIAVTTSRAIRAAAFADGALASPPQSASYVIDADLATRYASLRSVFVALPESGLARFQSRDDDWRGLAAFEMLSGSQRLFKLDAEASVGGQFGSGASPQVSMNVAARDAFGVKSINATLWPDKPAIRSTKKLRLRNGSNDWNGAHLRDQLSQRAAAGGPNLYGSSNTVAMFVNGQYYGMMDLREREDETLAANNVGVDNDHVDDLYDPLLDGQEIKNGGVAALASYQALHDAVVTGNHATARTMFATESLAWDWAHHMFHGNTDWPHRNVHVWRSPAYDGLWRWHAHDMDFAFGYSGRLPSTDLNYLFDQPGGEMVRALLATTDFRDLYINAAADQMNLMTPARMNALLDLLVADMQPYVADHFAKTPTAGSVSSWQGHVATVRNYIDQRETYFDQHTRQKFGLLARVAVNVRVSDLAHGSVKVNLLDTGTLMTQADPSFTGRYYPNVPIELTAIPKPGYRFTGWQGDSTSTARSIRHTPSAGSSPTASFVALFEPETTATPPVLAAVPAQTWRTGDLVELRLQATDVGGRAITYDAKSMPKGLSVHPASGVIFGRITTPGSGTMTVSAANGSASTSKTSLPVSWTVTDAPSP
jgi:CotH kinase protein/Lamin Tail Domain/Chitobiase/beta-hexosaminidase C-terminal domain/Putative Ig domain/Divergent InlB B-repeat domain